MAVKKKELTLNQRWEKGLPHDDRSIELYESLAKIDGENGDSFDFKSGGDGDNGENLLYLLDVYFERKDNAK